MASANIADLTVGTIKITGNAVTVPGAVYFDPVSFSAGVTTEIAVMYGFVNTGAPVLIWYSFIATGTAVSSTYVTPILYHDTTVIQTGNPIWVWPTPYGYSSVAGVFLHSAPSAGTRDYHLKVTAGAADGVARSVCLAVMELKK